MGRNKKSSIFLALVFSIFVLFVSGCGKNNHSSEPADKEPQTRIIVDGAGREVEIPEEVTSVVPVNVGALRYTSYMQATDLVVGVEDYEKEQNITRLYNYINFDDFKDLPIIGENGEQFVEEIIKVDPDVIVMAAFGKENDADELSEKTGIPVVVIQTADGSFDEEVYDIFKVLGELYKKEDRAKELSKYLDDLKEDLHTRTEGIKEEDKPSVYVGGVSFKGAHGFDGTEAWYAPFAQIGANNVANSLSDETKHFNVDLEQVLVWDPEIVFVDSGGLKLVEEDFAENPSYYESLSAFQNDRVYSQISFRSSAVNLETALANTYYAATVIYPEEFKAIDPIEKADEIFEKFLGQKAYHLLKEHGYEFKQLKFGE